MTSTNFFQDHLSNQEGILQSTRSLHYVFQAIFLGIGFAMLTIGFSVAVSIDKSKGNWVSELFTILLLACISIFIIVNGKRFLSDYSKNVYKRGVVIDVLQHLRMASRKNSLEEILEVSDFDELSEILFYIIKIVERIASNYGGYYRNIHMVQIYSNSKSAPLNDLMHIKRFDLLIFIAFWGDIYSFKYPDSITSWNFYCTDSRRRIKLREISSTRNGHKSTFENLWGVLIVMLVVLIVFAFLKTYL